MDCFVVVFAAAHPKPNLAVADRFLVMAEKSDTDIIFCINKTDLDKKGMVQRVEDVYKRQESGHAIQHGTGDGEYYDEGHQQEDSAAVFTDQIGKPPDIAADVYKRQDRS